MRPSLHLLELTLSIRSLFSSVHLLPGNGGNMLPSSVRSLLASLQSDGVSSFLRAARAGNLSKVVEYLKGSINIDTSNANGLNALHLASKEGHVHIIEELLSRGAKINAATKVSCVRLRRDLD